MIDRVTSWRNGGRGFTLLEMLVALAIFALLSVLGYTGLQSLMNAQSESAGRSDAFAQLTRAMGLLQQDIEQTVARPVRDTQGDALAPLIGSLEDTPYLELSRDGWLNLARAPVPTLQRVGYRLAGEQLIRRTWSVLDRAPDSTPQERVLLQGVERLQLRYLDTSGTWETTWPPAATPAALPMAIELQMDTRTWGALRRVFRVSG